MTTELVYSFDMDGRLTGSAPRLMDPVRREPAAINTQVATLVAPPEFDRATEEIFWMGTEWRKVYNPDLFEEVLLLAKEKKISELIELRDKYELDGIYVDGILIKANLSTRDYMKVMLERFDFSGRTFLDYKALNGWFEITRPQTEQAIINIDNRNIELDAFQRKNEEAIRAMRVIADVENYVFVD